MFLGEIKMRELLCLNDLKFNEYGYIKYYNGKAVTEIQIG